MLSYKQGVAPFRATSRLPDRDRAKLMGGTLEKVYTWSGRSLIQPPDGMMPHRLGAMFGHEQFGMTGGPPRGSLIG
jgi:hypothetical protein